MNSGRLTPVFLWILVFLITSCQQEKQHLSDRYFKQEYRIAMRDSVRLFTSVYIPKDTSQTYPILLQRTPYSAGPYGADTLRNRIGPSDLLVDDQYIFVFQDVRGRFMSEGKYVNMRPVIPDKSGPLQTDESSDTYDTIDWLVNHIPANNGRVGIWGISYPGFYSTMSLIDAHPALKAVSPQAPIADWFLGDDTHHNGAFSLILSFNFLASFGQPRPEPIRQWPPRFKHGTPDGYRFFLDLGPLPNANAKYFHHEIAFWDSLMLHGTYDRFWQKRNPLPYLEKVTTAVLVVGGWYDAEDLYGTLHTYKAIEKQNPAVKNNLVMGPWYHGGWSRSNGRSLGDIDFGRETSVDYRQYIERPFFNYHLKETGTADLPEMTGFDTGTNTWHAFERWPASVRTSPLYLHDNSRLSFEPYQGRPDHDDFISDPAHPVPFTAEITTHWGRNYMTEDQRFASRRPDVLSYESVPLEEMLTLAGPVAVDLTVSTSGTDADWIVKLIDVYPDSFPDPEPNPQRVRMGGYQRLLRAEIMRSRFRHSYTTPQPMIPDEPTKIQFILQDVFHTFKPGHKIMIQVQSSWFPLFDRNPQTFVDIYHARESDFQKASHRVYYGSKVMLPVLPQGRKPQVLTMGNE